MAIQYKPGTDKILKFIPSFEVGQENPTTFHIRPESIATGMLRDRLFKVKFVGDEPSVSLKNADFESAGIEEHIDYFLSRIVKIDNTMNGPNIMTLDSEKDIREFLMSEFPGADKMGRELNKFLRENSGLTESERKN